MAGKILKEVWDGPWARLPSLPSRRDRLLRGAALQAAGIAARWRSCLVLFALALLVHLAAGLVLLVGWVFWTAVTATVIAAPAPYHARRVDHSKNHSGVILKRELTGAWDVCWDGVWEDGVPGAAGVLVLWPSGVCQARLCGEELYGSWWFRDDRLNLDMVGNDGTVVWMRDRLVWRVADGFRCDVFTMRRPGGRR